METKNFFSKDGKRSLIKPTVKTTSTPTVKTNNPLLSQDCINLLNYRIEQEEFSSRLYLSMSLWLNDNGYINAAKVWKTYSVEEAAHADWARTYLLSLGIQPNTPALDAPGNDYTGLPEIIKLSFDHEITITTQIKELGDYAFSMGDHMLYTLVSYYLKEQVEEHDKTQNLMDQLKAFGEDKIALRLLDNALGE